MTGAEDGIPFALALAGVLCLVRCALFRMYDAPRNVARTAGTAIESLLYTWVPLSLVVRPLLFTPCLMTSTGMEPTIGQTEVVAVARSPWRWRSPKRGDVILFDALDRADLPKSRLLDRVIGLPGDLLDIRIGKVYLNEDSLIEPYLQEPMFGPPYTPEHGQPDPPYHVPKRRCFVLGDNRNDCLDSRHFGSVSTQDIRGFAFAVVWPIQRMRWLGRPQYPRGVN